MNARMFKMPFRTRHFNLNQRVWIVSMSGNEAAMVTGKFRGKGRYVSAWVNWRAHSKAKPEIQEFEVSEAFILRHRLWVGQW